MPYNKLNSYWAQRFVETMEESYRLKVSVRDYEDLCRNLINPIKTKVESSSEDGEWNVYTYIINFRGERLTVVKSENWYPRVVVPSGHVIPDS